MKEEVRHRTTLNTEYDSRIVRVSMGAAGMTKPDFVPGGMERLYCIHCGKPGGAITADLPPALWHDPGVIYVCPACDGTFGRLPAHAIGFTHRKEGD